MRHSVCQNVVSLTPDMTGVYNKNWPKMKYCPTLALSTSELPWLISLKVSVIWEKKHLGTKGESEDAHEAESKTRKKPY